nr:DUF2283 domain-containing protein [Candidatus Sigynarchaeum springense]
MAGGGDTGVDITCDNVADALNIHLAREKLHHSDEADSCPGIIIDHSKGGGVVGIEVLDFSRRQGLDLNALVKLSPDEVVPAVVKCT